MAAEVDVEVGVFARIKQFFSFLSIRFKYGKFDINADKHLRFSQFREKYLALKKHPGLLKWALGGQTLHSLSDEVNKMFFLAVEFPDIFKLTTTENSNSTPIQKSINQDVFSIAALSFIANMLIEYFVNNQKHIVINEKDVADLFMVAIRKNNYRMFVYLSMQYTEMTRYFSNDLESLVDEKLKALYKSSNVEIPWFVSLITKEKSLKFKVTNENDYDLHSAVFYLHDDSIDYLLKSSASARMLNMEDENHKTPYEIAILQGSYIIAAKLLTKIDKKVEAVNRALYKAAYCGNEQAVEHLLTLNHEIDIENFTDLYGYKKVGIFHSCFEKIYAVYERNNVNAIDLRTGDLPLHKAVRENNANYIKLLCDNKANVFLKNRDGLSPIDLALQLKNQYAFNALMNYVDCTKINIRESWSVRISWRDLVGVVADYLKSFPKMKNKNVIDFIIGYFFTPFCSVAKNDEMKKSYINYLKNKIESIDDLENQEDFKLLSLRDKLIAIADKCKIDKSYVARMRVINPALYELMIDDNLYHTCSSILNDDDANKESAAYVDKLLQCSDFTEFYSKALKNIQPNFYRSSKAAKMF